MENEKTNEERETNVANLIKNAICKAFVKSNDDHDNSEVESEGD